ncbi:MAG: asparagine synthetase B [Balneolaceae bacterium]|nr:asparagine synthetase B [Balneolaceae bacterium]MCH8548646.1 asparagine synthetase B [Balneolaceae bacterium]
MKRILLLLLIFLIAGGVRFADAQQRVLIPMDGSQTDHLKAYGIIFHHLMEGETGQWLLNYRGGSFLTTNEKDIVRRARVRNVRIEVISESDASAIVQEVEHPGVNMAAVNLEAAPTIAVYTPPDAMPWDDAVVLALEYAEIPFDRIYNKEVLSGELDNYDWLHLHHEDFTGQHGKFWSIYRNSPWYIASVRKLEDLASELGYRTVSDLKLDVVHEIRDFVGNGGFMFAMCSATETFDVALASDGINIVPPEIGGDPLSSDVNNRLDYSNTFAFENFEVVTDPHIYAHSSIDIEVDLNRISESLDYFTLFDFSAKWDPVPTMLTQNHVNSIRGFYGQATAFRTEHIKSSAVVLAESPGRDQVKYLHGNHGEGTFTFYGGHDPEDYTHRVGDPPTDLSLHPNSPGYRLILNNVLFPAAEQKKRQT